MARIKNMGTSTMKFGEGIIASGSVSQMSTTSAEDAAIHSSGSLMLSSETDTTGIDIEVQSQRPRLKLSSHSGGAFNSAIILDKFNNSGDGSLSAVVDGMTLSQIDSNGYDGSTLRNATSIKAVVDGTPGSGDMPGRLEFRTSPDGAASVVTRMTIKNDGKVGVGTTDPDYELDVDGDIGLSEYIYHNGDEDTFIRFPDADEINLTAGGESILQAYGAGASTMILILSGGSSASPDEGSYTDTNFFVSGSIDSKGTATKGTAVFGGDVVISGSVYSKHRWTKIDKFSKSGNYNQFFIKAEGTGNQGGTGSTTWWIPPTSGRLISAHIRAPNAMGSTEIKLHTANAGTPAAAGFDNVVETQTVNVDTANTNFAFNFNNAEYGDDVAIGLSVSGSSPSGDGMLMTVWEYDFFG